MAEVLLTGGRVVKGGDGEIIVGEVRGGEVTSNHAGGGGERVLAGLLADITRTSIEEVRSVAVVGG